MLFWGASLTLQAQAPLGDLRERLRSFDKTDATSPAAGLMPSPEKKSAGLAVLYSILLPGMGEWYAGDMGSGKYPLIAEGAIWLTYGSLQSYGSWMRSDARAYARAHAGFTDQGKNDQFYVDVGNFSNVYQYNDKKLQDRDLAKVYDPTAGNSWSWDTDASRQRYRSLRSSSDAIITNSGFILAAAVVNRVVSAVNAAFIVRRYNRAIDEGLGAWNIESSVTTMSGKPDGILISLSRSF
jgi:hypothetical protein